MAYNELHVRLRMSLSYLCLFVNIMPLHDKFAHWLALKSVRIE
jgi:hypothetical protein